VRKLQRGFTLIELLVVATIAAVLVGVAALSVNFGGGDKQVEDEARRLAALLQLAADDAVLRRRELGLRVTTGGYAFYQLDQSGEEPSWQPVDKDPRLRERSWPEALEIEMEIEGQPIVLDAPGAESREPQNDDDQAPPVQPQVMFLSNGESLPYFAVLLRHPDLPGGWRLQSGEERLLDLQRDDF